MLAKAGATRHFYAMTAAPDPPPARAPWPPILMVAAVLAGLVLDRLSGGAGRGLIDHPALRILGGAMISGALAIELWCALIFARRDTTILPHRAASALATEGPFRWSRNPIYVAHVTLVAGVGLVMASPFTLLMTPLLAAGLTRLAVIPEERHLLAKFGDDYRAYMARTRRWL